MDRVPQIQLWDLKRSRARQRDPGVDVYLRPERDPDAADFVGDLRLRQDFHPAADKAVLPEEHKHRRWKN